MTNLFTNYSAKAQILATKKLIENSTQKPNSAWYFRPPWGAINKDIEKVLEDENIKPVLADIFMAKAQAFKDFKSIEPVDKTSKKILNNTQNGSIILLHLSDYRCNGERVWDTPNTAAILEQVIPALKERGFVFVSLSELLNDTEI